MEEGFDAWINQNKDNDAHRDESTWLRSTCSRSEAETLLVGKPTGTFLLRPSSSGGYALSIVCNNTTNHCIIFDTTSGFGFAKSLYSLYDSLQSLVLHYSQSSLEEHNDLLKTTLKYPIGSSYIEMWEKENEKKKKKENK